VQALIFASWGLLFGPADEAATRRGLSEVDACVSPSLSTLPLSL
jgi:hypothetical protein